RSKYRFDLSKDSETQTADNLINQIKHIHNTISNLGHKQYKLMNLAKRYKMSERQLERLYIASLIQEDNHPIQTLKELRAKYGNNVNEWFVQGLLPKGSVTLLHSLGGVGKTRLIYDLMFAMVTGTSWGSQFPVTAQTRRCLIVQTDESPNDMIRSLNSRGFTDDMPIYVKTNWSVEHLPELRREIIENNIDVVLIDSLTSVNRNSIISENDTEYARPILQLKDLAQELNVSIVINHHSNSGGKSRGTKAIHNSVSQVLCLKLPSEQSKASCPNRLLIFEKSRFRRPTEYKLAFNFDEETYQWSWVCEGENREPSEEDSISDIILKLLMENRNKCFSAEEIAKLCKLAVNTVRKILFKLSELDKLIGRKRSKKKGRPWLHFLRWDLESPPPEENLSEQEEAAAELTNPEPEKIESELNTSEPQEIETELEDKEDLTDLTDLTNPEGVDQVEPSQGKRSIFPDPTIVKIPKVLAEQKQKKCRSGISEKKVNPESVVQLPIETNLLTDPLPDLVTDPQKKDQEGGSVTRPQEIFVRYVGTDPELARICALSKDIKILGKIDDKGMCFIWAENWSQPTQVFYDDLAEPETT
ncbi:MAG: AAA family ATPase, partial [Crocosphaera sp.]|nr:AAA family ATPase [Crocosphaera sp.]